MSDRSTRITGGCQCGAVRYALNGRLNRPSICHCRMCQKAFGSFFAPLVGVKVSAFELTRGTLSIFKSSDAVERGFCRDCGTPLSFHYVGSDVIDVSIGSLDDPSIAKPVIQYGIESRLPWVSELADLPGRTTEEDDSATRLELIRRTNHQHPDSDTANWSRPGQR
jgi:hypothetical protein